MLPVMHMGVKALIGLGGIATTAVGGVYIPPMLKSKVEVTMDKNPSPTMHPKITPETFVPGQVIRENGMSRILKADGNIDEQKTQAWITKSGNAHRKFMSENGLMGRQQKTLDEIKKLIKQELKQDIKDEEISDNSKVSTAIMDIFMEICGDEGSSHNYYLSHCKEKYTSPHNNRAPLP